MPVPWNRTLMFALEGSAATSADPVKIAFPFPDTAAMVARAAAIVAENMTQGEQLARGMETTPEVEARRLARAVVLAREEYLIGRMQSDAREILEDRVLLEMLRTGANR